MGQVYYIKEESTEGTKGEAYGEGRDGSGV